MIKEMPQQQRIRDLNEADEPAWRRLWAGYLDFYQAELTDEQTNLTWRRLMDPSSAIKGLVAYDVDSRVVGFCNYVLHPNTWTSEPVCYLEDLYVEKGVRGDGVGEALIRELSDRMKSEGWSRVYWNTKENNYRARGLYDKFSRADGFVRYVIKRPI
jgi:ribosomal protein S18 acetylase RimI-like enzyme